MMNEMKVTSAQLKLIDKLVDHFNQNKKVLSSMIDSLDSYIGHSENLKGLIHSKKHRIKEPDHLKDKLIRKADEANKKKKPFVYTKENLFSKITDLAGFRIIHLHTKQIEQIDIELRKILEEQRWKIIEGPKARTWDDESREYFKSIGIKTLSTPNLYTSVHYIIKPNTKSALTCEIQVRTLMEEVWGEVDHKINYPHKSESISCREQIKALARVTSSCSRLVDSIFTTHEHEKNRDSKLTSSKSTAKKAVRKPKKNKESK
jgi:ppGpp synthetase/RelA/SpoT-type nucleotidyltranferase